MHIIIIHHPNSHTLPALPCVSLDHWQAPLPLLTCSCPDPPAQTSMTPGTVYSSACCLHCTTFLSTGRQARPRACAPAGPPRSTRRGQEEEEEEEQGSEDRRSRRRNRSRRIGGSEDAAYYGSHLQRKRRTSHNWTLGVA